MILGKQNIIAWFESLDVPYWVLFAKGKVESGNPISKSDDRDNATVNNAIDHLRKILDLQSRGQFTLIASPKNNVTSRGGFRQDFEINGPETSTTSSANPGIFGMPQSIGELDELTNQRAQKMIESVKLEMQLQKLQDENEVLKKENKELEKEADKGANKFWEAINGIGLDKIIGAFMTKGPQAAPAVTGVPPIAEPLENDHGYALRLSKVISIFQEADPDWLDTLEKMANKIQSDPSVIKMFKKFL